MSQYNMFVTEEDYDKAVSSYFATVLTVGLCTGFLSGILTSILVIKFVL